MVLALILNRSIFDFRVFTSAITNFKSVNAQHALYRPREREDRVAVRSPIVL